MKMQAMPYDMVPKKYTCFCGSKTFNSSIVIDLTIMKSQSTQEQIKQMIPCYTMQT